MPNEPLAQQFRLSKVLAEILSAARQAEYGQRQMLEAQEKREAALVELVAVTTELLRSGYSTTEVTDYLSVHSEKMLALLAPILGLPQNLGSV